MRLPTKKQTFLIFAGFFLLLNQPLTPTDAEASAPVPDFDKPVEYAPLYIKDVKPDIISLERLQKGLDVIYYLEYFERDLNSIPKTKNSSYKTVKGKPILELNHQFGKEEVFDSGTNRGVAMRMKGYIFFDKKGEYQLQALSNDGIGVMLGGKVVISDPEQHADRLSNIGYVTIDQPGYYAALIEYFQRKGTASLKLFWKTPDSSESVPIPQNAYVHLP